MEPATKAGTLRERRQRFGARAIALLVVFGALLVLTVGPRLDLSFGPSHDGENAAVWGSGSRALREDGVANSRLGTRRSDGTVYARHPPAIVVETAASEWILGERRWSTRLPAFVGSLATVALVVLLLSTLEIPPLAAVGGVALAFGSTMFAGYAAMVDTPVVGLPFGVTVILLWRLAATGRRVSRFALASAAFAAVLTSWLGLLTVVAVGIAAGIRRADRTTASALAIGGAVGVAVLGAWLLWAYGSFAPLAEALRDRTGQGQIDVGTVDALRIVLEDWRELLPVWLVPIALLGLALSVRRAATRATAGVLVAVIAVWTVGFREGAFVHDYWTYWVLVPFALGAALALEEVAARWPRGGDARVLPVMAAAAVALGGLGLSFERRPMQLDERKSVAGAVVERAALQSTQRVAWYIAPQAQDVPWLSYLERRPAHAITNLSQVRALAKSHPGDLVFVVVNGAYRMVAAGDLPAMAARDDIGLAGFPREGDVTTGR